MLADRRLYLDRHGTLVAETDPSVAFLLAAKGHEIPAGEVKRLGLQMWSDGRVMQGPEPVVEMAPEPMPEPEPEPEVMEPPVRIMPPEVKRSRRRK